MPNDEAVRHTSEPALIRTSDQPQQAKRAEAPVTAGPFDQQRDSSEASMQNAGILRQLQAERAHD
jgi:hypothetical protein